jgi:anti-sigma B factor antagonist
MTPVSVSGSAEAVLAITLRGEIDYTNAQPVTGKVVAAIADTRPATVRVDLTEVTFLDSSGIGVLISAMKAARSADAEYLVVGAGPIVLDQLEITGLVELFPVRPAPPGAAAG